MEQSILGSNAALKMATGGILGKKYVEGIIPAIDRTIQTTNTIGVESTTKNDEYQVDSDSISVIGTSIALHNKLTDQEKSWYTERGQLLSSKITESSGTFSIGDYGQALPGGFEFDIEDDLEYLSFMTTSIFPGAQSSGSEISKEIIKAGKTKAFISACLIELLLFLHSKGYNISGGFGIERASNTAIQGSDRTRLTSGTPDKPSKVTDHAFGRAFDLFTIVNKNEKMLSVGSSLDEYIRQLNILLSVLNTAPPHLLPDYLKIGRSCPDEYVQTPYQSANIVSKIAEKYPNLKYVKINRDDPDDSTHTSHIHISFAPSRAGKYTGPSGKLTIVNAPSSKVADSRLDYINETGFIVSPELSGININRLSKSYQNDKSQLSDIEVYYLLSQYGNFSPEISALFTAIAWRESAFSPYAANEFGYFGLFQIGTRAGSDGKNTSNLILPASEKNIAHWKLAYVNWETEGFTEQTIDKKLEQVQSAANNFGLQHYDPRVWIPRNQMALLRGKIAQKDFRKKIEVWGKKTLTSLGGPWGDNYWKNGFIGGLSFKVAADVYTKGTGKSSDVLKKWVLENIPLDSPTRKNDSKYGITKLEVWVDLSKYTPEVLATQKKALYKQESQDGLVDEAA